MKTDMLIFYFRRQSVRLLDALDRIQPLILNHVSFLQHLDSSFTHHILVLQLATKS